MVMTDSNISCVSGIIMFTYFNVLPANCCFCFLLAINVVTAMCLHCFYPVHIFFSEEQTFVSGQTTLHYQKKNNNFFYTLPKFLENVTETKLN